jgi:acyl-CoA hydrolase
MTPRPHRSAEHSRSTLTYRMGVTDANVAGNVHGGWIMKLCDDVAVVAARRHTDGMRVVTAAVDGMRFRHPVHVDDVLTLRASVNAAWRTSMEVGVRVESDNLQTGVRMHTCTAYLTLVALDDDEKPTEVPQLIPETPEERRRWREATLRRDIRLSTPDDLRIALR